ncbi:hypothetical protein D9M68_665960 [compost metagenome]
MDIGRHIAIGLARARHGRRGHVGHHGDGAQVVVRVVSQFAVGERKDHEHRRRAQVQRQAVRLGSFHRIEAQPPRRARPVLDDNVGETRRLQLLGVGPGHGVGRSAGRVADHEPQHFGVTARALGGGVQRHPESRGGGEEKGMETKSGGQSDSPVGMGIEKGRRRIARPPEGPRDRHPE